MVDNTNVCLQIVNLQVEKNKNQEWTFYNNNNSKELKFNTLTFQDQDVNLT